MRLSEELNALANTIFYAGLILAEKFEQPLRGIVTILVLPTCFISVLLAIPFMVAGVIVEIFEDQP